MSSSSHHSEYKDSILYVRLIKDAITIPYNITRRPYNSN